MAINDLIGKIFSSQYIAGVKQNTPLLSIANDRSSEVATKGDGLVIPLTQNLRGADSVKDYPAAGTAITYGSVDPTKVDFVLDKEKYAAFEVEDTDRAQLAFDVFAEAARQEGQDMAIQLNADIRATIKAAADATGANALPASSKFAQEIANSGDTEAQRETLNLLFLNIKQAMLTLGYTATPVVIIHPSTWKRLMQYVIVDKGMNLPNVAQTAFVDGTLSGVFGIDFIVDWGATIDGTDENDNADSYILLRGRTVTYAGQLSQVEQMRSPDRFATRWRALNTYGNLVQEKRSLMKLSQTVAS